MNPYRQSPLQGARTRRRRFVSTSSRKTAGLLLATLGVYLAPLALIKTWLLGGAALLVCLGVIIAITGRSRTPLTRLAALTWHRGDRFGALLLLFNVVTPRYSQKRIAKQKAALAAAQASGIPYKSYGVMWLIDPRRRE